MTSPLISIPESVHAILSPSKAHLWLACTGGLAAAKDQPFKPPSRYAAEGTVYHDVARRALTEDKDCAAYIGDRYEVNGFQFTVDADNAESAQVYVDLVRGLPGKRFIEVDLEYSALLGVPKTHTMPDGSIVPVAAGTGDCVVLDYEHKVIYGIDLKFGKGDVVYAKENPQLRLYMAAAVARYALLGIEDDWLAIGGICQPRVHHYDTEQMTVGELKAWTVEQRQKANEAYTLYASPHLLSLSRLTPGEKQCRWCPLSGNCAAQNQKVLGQFPKGHATAAIPSIATLDDVQIAEAMLLADEYDNWASAVRAEGLKRALQGAVLPHWKLGEGRRGARALNAELRLTLAPEVLVEIGVQEVEGPGEMPVEDAIHFALKDAAYTRELKTAAQLEKLLAKKFPLLWGALQEAISQKDGAPKLLRMEDPRPPLPIVSQEFPTVEPGVKPSLV